MMNNASLFTINLINITIIKIINCRYNIIKFLEFIIHKLYQYTI
jgi:hypothetical protein